MTQKSRLRKVVFLNSLTPILVIAIILVIALRLQRQVTAAQSGVTRTLKVETEIEAIQAGLLSAESAVRAFVLTRNTAEFDLYKQNSDSVPGKLKALQLHVAGDDVQSERAGNLSQLAARRLKLLEQVAELAPRGLDPPSLISQGRLLMEQVNAQANVMLRTEEQGLARRSSDLERVRAVFTAAIWAALGAVLVCGLRVCSYVHLRVIQRLESLTRDVEEYGVKKEPIPPDDSVTDEIGALRRVFAETANHLSAERDRAEIALASKGDFLACMSHEIRTPMTGIMGLVDLTLRSGDLPENHRQSLEEVQRSSQTLLSLINDILDFSKIESGKMRLDLVPCDLRALVDSSADLFRPQAQEKRVALEVDVAPDLDCHVLSDPTRLRQIAGNLISNAVKFTASGFVRVSLRRSSLTPDVFEFTVHDTGIGIAPEFRERLFQPFSQADLSTTRTFGGTGLGLCIVKRLVDLMGGDIALESQSGLGSRFVVLLPLQANGEVSQAGQRAASAKSRKIPAGLPHVLLAEDNSTNQLVVKKILQSSGCRVTVVDNGEEAVAAARNEHFDLILMDCRMPRMDGYEATRKIRALPNGCATVPIIALTANAFKADEELCRQSGMNGFLSKPFDLEELLDKCFFWIRSDASDLSEELRAIFLAEYPGRFAELIQALRRQDYRQIAETSHWLRGGSSHFFGPQLAGRLTQLEKDARRQTCRVSEEDIQHLTELFETVCSDLRSLASVG